MPIEHGLLADTVDVVPLDARVELSQHRRVGHAEPARVVRGRRLGEDLERRGPGEFLGQRQSGVPEFVLADLSAHRDLLSLARREAQHMLAAGQTIAAHRDMLLSLFERDEAVRFLASG